MANYWLLPYEYVLTAVMQLGVLQQEELHNYERPISYIAYQNAEINRDRKKQRKPHKIDDFYFYSNKELANLPEPRYGAAAIALIEQKLFPSWALFVYSDLKSRASDALPPELLCLQCDDALVLAPIINDGTMTGMLIASESASNGVRTLKSPCGLIVEARIPMISSKFQATEDTEINILRIIKPHS